MKNFILFLLMGSFLFCSKSSYSGGIESNPGGAQENDGVVAIVCSPDVADLSSALVSSYNQQHPDQKFVIRTASDFTGQGSVRFFSKSGQAEFAGEPSGKIVVGHDIIVPVMHRNNPLAGLIEAEGLTSGDFRELLGANPEWKNLKADGGNVPLRVVVSDNPTLISALAEYSQMEVSSIEARRIASAEEFLAVVQKDMYTIGFCRLTDVLDAEKGGFAENIQIIPIDKNRDGRIDRHEQIYSTPAELARGVWIGKYPRKLCNEIYAAPSNGSFDEASADFLAWVITDGQETITTLGYSSLLTREKTAGMLVLRPVPPSGFTAPAPLVPNLWVVAISLVAILFLVYVVVRLFRKRKSGIQSEDIAITSALNVESIQAPAGLFYDKTHTWAFMEQNGLVKVGVNDFLQHITGTLSQVKMKSTGDKVRKGEKIVTIIRQGKQLEIYSPVTGIIKTRNQELLANPATINADPYTAGWVYQVEPSNWLRETKFMFMAEKFSEWLEDEFVRLKDFLASSANANTVVYNHIVLQDGGELTDNVLANMEPKVWEDFQTQFMDVSR